MHFGATIPVSENASAISQLTHFTGIALVIIEIQAAAISIREIVRFTFYSLFIHSSPRHLNIY